MMLYGLNAPPRLAPGRVVREARRARAEVVAAALRGAARGFARGGRAVAAFVRAAGAGAAKRAPAPCA